MILEEVYYDIFLLIFFGGIQYHFLKAIFFHFLGLNITWGATSKEYNNKNILLKLKTYYDMYLISFGIIIGCSMAIYFDDSFLNLYSTIPLILNLFFHIIMPLVL